MRLFDRSILAEVGRNALLLTLALTAVMTAVLLVRLLGTVARGELPADLFFPYLPWAIAEKGAMVVLLSTFAATLLTVQRWVRDSEWIVWRSLGVARARLLLPLTLFALVTALIVAWLTLIVTPYAEQQKDRLKALAQSRDETETVVPGVFRESRNGERVFFVAPQGEEAIGAFFLRQWHDGRQIVVVADRAEAANRPDGRWLILYNGSRYEEGTAPLAFRVTAFASLALWVTPPTVVSEGQRAHAMDTPLLVALLARGERFAAGELLLRVGLPLAAIVLMLVALPLAETEPRATQGAALLVALLFFFAYTNAISLAQAYVARGRLPFAAGLLLPHLLFALLALAVAWWRLRRIR